MSLDIVSLNTRGLRDDFKRKTIFKWLQRYHNALNSFTFLQETHSTAEVERVWENDWCTEKKCKLLFSHGTNLSCGVIIIPPSNIDYIVHEVVCDENGRYVILKVEMFDKLFCVCNVYAPSDNEKNKLDFLNNLIKSLEMYVEEGISFVLGGDFNVHLNPILDLYNCRNPHKDGYCYGLLSMCDELGLTDVWRAVNPDVKRYTWRRCNPLCQSRLDYWFAPINMLYDLNSVDIKPSIRTDHSLITVSFKLSTENVKRGPGYWKFNNSLLHDENYVSKVKEIIQSCKEKYRDEGNKSLKWDLTKMEIRQDTISYSKKASRKKRARHEKLLHDLNNLEVQLGLNPTDEILMNYNVTKRELEAIEAEKTMGAIIRAKANAVEYGEKNTKFFCNLEKRQQSAKNITTLYDTNGKEVHDPRDILDLELNFYKSLYSSKIAKNTAVCNYNFFLNDNVPKICNEDKMLCEADITLNEIGLALQALPNGKSPGSDGFTTDFLKFFWPDIRDLVFESFKYSFESGELSIDQKRGILSLIPKKDKDLRHLGNWRPISLLNTDYKILTKLLAIRLNKVLPNIIHPDQVAYIKKRFIGQNIRLVYDVIEYCETYAQEGIIACIDFEKAFDTIEWHFLFKTLKMFNFGETFCKWIDIIYSGASACVINNGHATKFFQLERGIRQGCPISAYLFILAVETLAVEIRNNRGVNGIQIGPNVIKMVQMADDTTVFVQDVKSLRHVLSILFLFYMCSGLKINRRKTDVFHIGCSRSLQDDLFGLNWKNDFIHSLGIDYYKNNDDTTMSNFTRCFHNFDTVLMLWSMRKLSLIGKITVIKSIAMPKLLYVCSSLPVPEWFVEQVTKRMFNFLWSNKTEKIKRCSIISNYKDGGLKMVHFETMVMAQKAQWIKRLCSDDYASWKAYPLWIASPFSIDDVLRCSVKSNDLTIKMPIFYHQMLCVWAEINVYSKMSSPGIICSQMLWLNPYIRIGGYPVWDGYEDWYEKGIHCLNDILNMNEKCFHTLDCLSRNFGIEVSPINIMKYNSLKTSIPKTWMKLLNWDEMASVEDLYIVCKSKKTDISKMTNKMIYTHLINDITEPPTSQNYWNDMFHLNPSDWDNIYQLPLYCVMDTKIREFQYKILNRIFPCNSYVSKWNPDVSENCLTCNVKDTLVHFFYECFEVQAFWDSFVQWWKTIHDIIIVLSDKIVILGYFENMMLCRALNFCILVAKWYISKMKWHKIRISFQDYKKEITSQLRIEKFICTRNKTLDSNFKELNVIYNSVST